jgi:hypothetical protein
MATQTDKPWKTFTATAAALTRHARVKVNSSGLILACGATDSSIGSVEHDVAVSGRATVRLHCPTRFVTASAAITQGDKLEAAAAGRVATRAAGTAVNLQALEAATAAGDIIEAATLDV